MDDTHYEKENTQSDNKKDFQLKILLWLLGVIIAGSLVCLILGLIKAAVNALVVIAGVLLALALVVFFIYERGKWRLDTNRYDRKIKEMENRNSDNDN